MTIKGLIYEDFVNYKLPALFIIFPYCTFKCDKDAGCQVCQNSSLANIPAIEVDENELVTKYISNKITKSIVFGGLEPFCSFEDMIKLIKLFREKTDDDIVIYTGYNEDEIIDKVSQIQKFKNIIIKYGRFKYGDDPHFDEVLGVKLASNNQYAKKIS